MPHSRAREHSVARRGRLLSRRVEWRRRYSHVHENVEPGPRRGNALGGGNPRVGGAFSRDTSSFRTLPGLFSEILWECAARAMCLPGVAPCCESPGRDLAALVALALHPDAGNAPPPRWLELVSLLLLALAAGAPVVTGISISCAARPAAVRCGALTVVADISSVLLGCQGPLALRWQVLRLENRVRQR